MSLNSTLVDTAAYGSPEWVEARKRGLGASELASIVGVNPWQGEYALWLRKRGETSDDGGNAATRWGHIIEGLALDEYERLTGRELVRGETWSDRRWPHLWATLDARVKDQHIGVEVKATTRWREVPPHVRVQVQAQMAIADLSACDVVRVSPYGEPEVTTIEREPDAEAICDLAEAWWQRYMTGDEMPPVDGSREASAWLDRQRGTEEREATPEQEELLSLLRGIRQSREAAEADEKRVINQLKASMAATGVLRARGARVTWSEVKPRTVIDWKGVADEMGYSPLIVERHTTVSEPSTRFAVKFEEEES